MTLFEKILIGAAILICLPAALSILPRVRIRNATAAALFASWATGFITWYGFGHALTAFQMWYIDAFVVAVIFCKDRRTGWDWAVIGLFVPMWLAYFGTFSAYHQWWGLWFAAMAQFLFVGLDSLLAALRAAKARPIETGHPPGLGFAVAGAGGDG